MDAMKFDIAILDTLSIEDLTAVKERATALLKDKKVEVKEAEKAKKEEVKLTSEQKVKAAIAAKFFDKKGTTITFTMNGKVWTKEALKLSDKTVTVDMGSDVDTVRTLRYIHFDKITDVTPGVEDKPVEQPKAKLVKKAKGAAPEGAAALAAVAALDKPEYKPEGDLVQSEALEA